MKLFRSTFAVVATDAQPWPGDKIGGHPAGVVATEWPSCAECQRPLSFISQFQHDDDRLDLGGPGRVLTLWQCEHDPGMCDSWDAQSGANAAMVLEASIDQEAAWGPGAPVEIYPELVVAAWSEADDGVPPELHHAFFDDERHSALGEDWWGRGGFGTRLGGVPAWIQSAAEGPGPPWEFVGQVAEGHHIDREIPSDEPRAEIRSGLGGEFRFEPPAVEPAVRWIIEDETGWYVRGPNFGGGGIAYVFLDRSVDPPAALMFWQC